MKNTHRRLFPRSPVLSLSFALLALLLALPAPSPLRAAPKAPATGLDPGRLAAVQDGLSIPEPLRPWVGWVLQGEEHILCPSVHGTSDNRHCAWPARLSLALTEKGGRFSQSWQVYRKEWVPLPGNRKHWPQGVLVDGKPALVATPNAAAQGKASVDGDDGGSSDSSDEDSATISEDEEDRIPRVLLSPGAHVLTGTFLWDELPESLPVPKETALLTLSLQGKPVLFPSRDAEGQLWLQRQAKDEEEEVLDLTVHRHVEDDIPLILTTRIELRVSGKSREVLLGPVLSDQLVPIQLESPLPARLETGSRLRVQVRPGTHVLTLRARHEGPVKELVRPKSVEPLLWPPSEVWAVSARPSLRQVSIEGVSAIDPQQTTLPAEWKSLPCYPMGPGDTLRLVEQHRGDADRLPDSLTLDREMWLDFNGSGYTIHDRISGTLNQTWRLEVNAPTELGHVAMDGKDLFITRSQQGSEVRSGIELRQGRLSLVADSRLPATTQLSAVSWNADFHKVHTQLHLPPGWRLFHLSGADNDSGTWIRHWDLLGLFLVLLVAIAVGQLYGPLWGVFALLGLGLSLPETNAPRYIWLCMLGAEALRRALPASAPRLATVVSWVRIGLIWLLASFVLLFSAQQIRIALHPSLERQDSPLEDQASVDARYAQTNNLPGAIVGGKFDNAIGAPEPAEAQIQQQQQVLQRAEQAASDALSTAMVSKGGGGSGEGTIGLGNIGTIGRGYGKESPKKVSMNRRMYQKEYDPNAMVQTGPGLPRWRWNLAVLTFSGAVDRTQSLHIYLIPPWLNVLLLFTQVGLLLLLAVRLIGLFDPDSGLRRLLAKVDASPIGARGGLALVLVLLGLSASAHAAEIPSKEVLDQLRARLLQKPACHPTCASISRLALEVTRSTLRARLEISAANDTAIALPGSAEEWLPEQVFLDGKPATSLLRDPDGHIQVALPAGSHQVLLEGRLPARQTVQLALPVLPYRVEAKTPGWRLDGLHEDGVADENLQLTRLAPGAKASEQPSSEDDEAEDPATESADTGALQMGALPPFVRVERELQVGLDWAVETRVARLGPAGAAVVLEIPLLPGESVTTSEIRVQAGKALINMAPGDTEVTWRSLLAEKPQIDLLAPRNVSWTELWRLSVSPIWHVEITGIPSVHQQDGAGQHRPTWRPWPGESVQLAFSRPSGVPGRTLTIDHSELSVTPGLRATDATLTLRIRSSRGGQHALTLPPGAELMSVSIDDKTQPLRLTDRKLTVSLLPGSQLLTVRFREPHGIRFRYQTPEILLGSSHVNAEIRLEVGRGRWVLYAGGPRLGPAVLFWSLLVVVFMVALILGRIRLTPLGSLQWFLLGVGLTQTPVMDSGIVIAWLLFLGWRATSPDLSSRWLFNLRQLLLLGLTVYALYVLAVAIHAGLLGNPQMRIAGNGSHGHTLRWLMDRVPSAEGPLPTAWVLSVSILFYRVAMLLWALWMARSLLSWLRFAYQSFTTGKLWHKAPPKPAKVEPPLPEAPKAEPAPPADPPTSASS